MLQQPILYLAQFPLAILLRFPSKHRAIALFRREISSSREGEKRDLVGKKMSEFYHRQSRYTFLFSSIMTKVSYREFRRFFLEATNDEAQKLDFL